MANYTITITDTDEICMKTDMMSVENWINRAVEGKINNTKKDYYKNTWNTVQQMRYK